MNKQQPEWQPISMLPVFSEMLVGLLESSLEQLKNMHLVMDKPHVLDDQTLNRMSKLYSEQLDDHWLFEAQFTRWKQDKLSYAQEKEINRLIKLASKLKEANEEIMRMVRSIEDKTINKIVGMNDGEFAEALLYGEFKLQ